MVFFLLIIRLLDKVLAMWGEPNKFVTCWWIQMYPNGGVFSCSKGRGKVGGRTPDLHSLYLITCLYVPSSNVSRFASGAGVLSLNLVNSLLWMARNCWARCANSSRYFAWLQRCCERETCFRHVTMRYVIVRWPRSLHYMTIDVVMARNPLH